MSKKTKTIVRIVTIVLAVLMVAGVAVLTLSPLFEAIFGTAGIILA